MLRILLLLALLTTTAAAAPEGPPRLLVVLSVDQLRPDTLDRFRGEYRHGLRRLLEGARRYTCVHDHAATETGPGHSTLLTGRRPAATGIVGNEWLDRATGAVVYCVEDPASPLLGLPDRGRSPALMLCDALGDWMKQRDPKTRVWAIAGKDRSAIAMGGRGPDGALWFERSTGGFTSSRYYFESGLPPWVVEINGDGWLDALPENWSYTPSDSLRADDDERESPKFSRASPHPLRARDRRLMMERLYATPYVDAFTMRFARRAVELHDLGGDEVCDLLALSLSATDVVGHLYGPQSQEVRDCLLRLDREIGEFLDFLDGRKAPYVVVLTADHGVLPLPEATRVPVAPLLQRVATDLNRVLGEGDWFRFSPPEFYVRGEDAPKVSAALAQVLRALPEVAYAFTREELLDRDSEGEILDLVRRSWHPERSGDVVVVPKQGRLVTNYDSGTTHGSPWRYDREVPLLFWGAGIAAGRGEGEARTIDIAPTLARMLALPLPEGIDGAPLPLE